MDKYQLIDSTIVELDRLTVQGAANMNIVLNSLRRLTALREALRKEEDAAREVASE